MDTEDLIKGVLEQDIGMTVTKIPEGDDETPDFSASLGEERFLIEVKEKNGNPELVQARETALSADELYEFAQKIESKGAHRKILGKAKNQLDEYVGDEATFRVAWIHCVGLGNSASFDQIFASIYGSETVVDWGTENNPRNGECYYFRDSEFYKHRNSIDAVVITKENGDCKLCLNNHSPRYQALRSTEFAKKFECGVIDPPHEDATGVAFHVDGEVDRKNSREVLEFLKNKYDSPKLLDMSMNHFEAHCAVKNDET